MAPKKNNQRRPPAKQRKQQGTINQNTVTVTRTELAGIMSEKFGDLAIKFSTAGVLPDFWAMCTRYDTVMWTGPITVKYSPRSGSTANGGVSIVADPDGKYSEVGYEALIRKGGLSGPIRNTLTYTWDPRRLESQKGYRPTRDVVNDFVILCAIYGDGAGEIYVTWRARFADPAPLGQNILIMHTMLTNNDRETIKDEWTDNPAQSDKRVSLAAPVAYQSKVFNSTGGQFYYKGVIHNHTDNSWHINIDLGQLGKALGEAVKWDVAPEGAAFDAISQALGHKGEQKLMQSVPPKSIAILSINDPYVVTVPIAMTMAIKPDEVNTWQWPLPMENVTPAAIEPFKLFFDRLRPPVSLSITPEPLPISTKASKKKSPQSESSTSLTK